MLRKSQIGFMLVVLLLGQMQNASAAPGRLIAGQVPPLGAPLQAGSAAPAVPVLVGPQNGAAGVAYSDLLLQAAVADPDQDALTTAFYGREKPSEANTFTLAVLPDTQNYSQNYPEIFLAQTTWIRDNQAARAIAFVTHLGDIVQSGDADTSTVNTQWARANTAISVLDTPPADVPFGLTLGNHDQGVQGNPDSSTNHFNQYFGVSRFTGRPYYGGHYGANNDTNYQVFSGGGMDFVIIHLELSYNTSNATFTGSVSWADGILKANASRRGILVMHNLFANTDGDFSSQGQYVFNQLKDNPNLHLMLGGHVNGAARRSDLADDGHTVHSLLADYQSDPNGGNGYLRLLTFLPSSDRIEVTTYSPTLNQYRTDDQNQFSLSYHMDGGTTFELIASQSVPGAPGAQTVSQPWSSLRPSTNYEWYVSVSDGQEATLGPVWQFSTAAVPADVVSEFSVQPGPGQVELRWSTATEQGLLGFNVYREDPLTGLRVKLNEGLIPVKSGGQAGSTYTFIDRNVGSGQRFIYWLEALNSQGPAWTGSLAVQSGYWVYLPLILH